MRGNSRTSWGWVARSLHWSMAALILGQLALGKYAHELPLSPGKLDALMWHKSVGMTLLLLAAIRVAWTSTHKRPQPASPATQWHRTAAGLSHILLYVLMVAIPLTGWLMNSAKNVPFSIFRVIPLPSLISPDEKMGNAFQWCHETLAGAFLLLIVLHVLAAFWHHFHRRDSVLLRMLGIGVAS